MGASLILSHVCLDAPLDTSGTGSLGRKKPSALRFLPVSGTKEGMNIKNKPVCAPSILSADFTDIAGAVRLIEGAGCEWIHLDVMDGHFVPNLTFGLKMIADIREKTELFLDTHLMISNPEDYVDRYIEAGSDAVTFHLEATVHSHRILQKIKAGGAFSGISIVPSTPVEHLREILDMVDLVLVMSVNPGFGGQELIPGCLEKVRTLDSMRNERGLDFSISIDGGVNRGNSSAIREAGADILVTGNAFFKASDPAAEVAYLLGKKII